MATGAGMAAVAAAARQAVIVVHHSNRQGGARGIGKAEDVLDLVIKLAPPDDYSASPGARFVLSYEETRGIPGGAALRSFVAAHTQRMDAGRVRRRHRRQDRAQTARCGGPSR
jgi:hypothetical protein